MELHFRHYNHVGANNAGNAHSLLETNKVIFVDSMQDFRITYKKGSLMFWKDDGVCRLTHHSIRGFSVKAPTSIASIYDFHKIPWDKI